MAYPIYEGNGGIVGVPAGTTSINVPFPVGVSVDNILILDVKSWTEPGVPSGWNVLLSSSSHCVFWKRADGTETGTVNVASSFLYSGVIYEFSGCKIIGTPIEVVNSSSSPFSNLNSLGDDRLAVCTVVNEFTSSLASDSGTAGYVERESLLFTDTWNVQSILLTQQIENSSTADGAVDYSNSSEAKSCIGFYLIPEVFNPNTTVDLNTLSNVSMLKSISVETEGGPEADFKIQAIEDDVGNSGGTNTGFTAVSALANAIELADSNRKTHSGNSDLTAANLEGDDMAGARVLTDISTLTYYRENGSIAPNMRFNTSIWEYIGGESGVNEFIVKGRYAVALNGTTNSVTQAVTGVVDVNKCIPFITGFGNNSIADDADTASGVAYLEDATTMRVQKGSNANNCIVYITLVEFTGSNWTVLHGDASSIADTGSIILRDGSDGTGTATNVSAWSEAIIFGHHRGNYLADGVDDALADLYPVYDVGTGLQTVDWTFDVNHAAVADNRHFIHVLNNSGLSVTRFQNASSAAGETTIDITSAGLTDTAQALIVGSSRTSGTGIAYARGWRNYYLNSTTQAAHWCHRSGNTMAHEIQIIDLSALQTMPSAGGDVSTDCEKLSALNNIHSPTISTEISVLVTPSLLLNNLNLLNPIISVIENISIPPTILNETLNLLSPTVITEVNTDITPNILSQNLSLLNPVISTVQNIEITPNILSLSITLIQPTIDLSENIEVVPNSIGFNINIINPNISTIQDTEIIVSKLSYDLSVFSPAIYTSSTVISNQLIVSDSVHNHLADGVVLGIKFTLQTQENLHSHTTDNISITQENILITKDSLHLHISSDIELVQDNTFFVNDSLHSHISQNISLDITPTETLNINSLITIIKYKESNITENIYKTSTITIVKNIESEVTTIKEINSSIDKESNINSKIN